MPRTLALDLDRTIVAIASSSAAATRGVVRMAGQDCAEVLARMGLTVPSRTSRIEQAIDLGPPLGEVEVGLMVWTDHRSYTASPAAELHVLGNASVLREVIARCRSAGAVLAGPGEFTMRAFLAGRLDLTQAEAVLGVIDADQPASLRTALGQLAGNLARPLGELRESLLDLLADLTAGLDFVDEDIEFVSDAQAITRMERATARVQKVVDTMIDRDVERRVPSVAILGMPNAGKSSLINALSCSDHAIESPMAGTTRDRIEVTVQIDEQPWRLIDTAGWEVNAEDIRGAMNRQTQTAIATADVRLWCVAIDDSAFAENLQRLQSLRDQVRSPATVDHWVLTKSDLIQTDTAGEHRHNTDFAEFAARGPIVVTTRVSDGLNDLRRELLGFVQNRDRNETSAVATTSLRCRGALIDATEHLRQAIEAVRSGIGHEFASDEIRLAVEAIGNVTGAVYTEDLLDRVFGRFCIGK